MKISFALIALLLLDPPAAPTPSGDGCSPDQSARVTPPDIRGQSNAPPPPTTTDDVVKWLYEQIIGTPCPKGRGGIGKPLPTSEDEDFQSRWLIGAPARVGRTVGAYSASDVAVRFAAVPGASGYQVRLTSKGEVRAERRATPAADGQVELSLSWPDAPPGDCWTALDATVEVTALDGKGACLVKTDPIEVKIYAESCMTDLRLKWGELAAAEYTDTENVVPRLAAQLRYTLEDAAFPGEALRLAAELDASAAGNTRVAEVLANGLTRGKVREQACDAVN